MKLRVFPLTAMICALCVGQASALEYTMDAPEDHLFGRPTSDDTIYEWENPNIDRSKNVALIPPQLRHPNQLSPRLRHSPDPQLGSRCSGRRAGIADRSRELSRH